MNQLGLLLLLDPFPSFIRIRHRFLMRRARNYAKHRRQIPTAYTRGEFDLEEWSDENIRRCFRFTREQLYLLGRIDIIKPF